MYIHPNFKIYVLRRLYHFHTELSVKFDITDWEQRKLSSITEKIRSYPLSRSVETNEYTGYKYVHYGDIHTGKSNIVDNETELPNIEPKNYDALQKGDLILADASEDYKGIGNPAVITAKTSYKIISGLHTIALRPIGMNSLFLYYLFHSPVFKRYGYKVGTGMKVFGISTSNILQFQPFLPLPEEQAKIAIFINTLENLAILHQRKYDALLKLKEAYLQNMFPAKGESTPKVRYANFVGDWEQRQLDKVGSFIRTSVNPKETTNDEFIEYSMPAYDNGRIPEIVIGESMQSSRLKISGDVLLINKLNVRQKRIWLVQDAPINAVASSEFMPYTSVDIDLGFLQQLMLSDKSTRDLEAMSSGTSNSQKRVTPADFLKYKVKAPIITKEQRQISEFFSKIDSLITLHQQKLEKLNLLKEAYLQKMFI